MPKEVRQKVPTQADVARLAGVSRPMVSYVLNNSTSQFHLGFCSAGDA